MANQYRNRSDGLVEQINSQDTIDSLTRSFIIYGVEGVVMTLTNSLIVCAILRFKSLREQKEFIIVGGLAFADGLNGLGFLIASVGRITLILRGDAFVLKSRWQCAISPWSIVVTFSNSLAGIALVMLSIDRLLAVSIPFRYFKFTNRYAFCIVGAAFAYVVPPVCVSYYLSYQYQTPEFPAYCLSAMGMHPAYYSYFVMFHLVTSFVSVILYIPVLITLRRVSEIIF
uniref:G-protein coupled receptors family 1 profile domain-containing protein n=1 Tax=Plectus sambesii TaxID=2011161 RepID=A0A914UX85_9BILA